MRKTCILVGNAPLEHNLSAQIDAADYVFRFNRTPEFGGRAGAKTDALTLITTDIGRWSRSGQCYRLFGRLHFEDSAAVKAAKQIIFPVNPLIIQQYYRTPYHMPPLRARLLKGRTLDWTNRLIALLGQDKDISIFSAGLYLRAAAELGIQGEKLKEYFPSSSFLCLQHCLEHFPPQQWQIKLCGFSFRGWQQHLWQAERDWVRQKQKEGLISLL